jgi:hypothetical protein
VDKSVCVSPQSDANISGGNRPNSIDRHVRAGHSKPSCRVAVRGMVRKGYNYQREKNERYPANKLQ